MAYTTLASITTALNISGNDQDNILNQLIGDANVFLNKELDIDGFEEGEVEEKIKFLPQAYSQWGYYMFYLKNFNVSKILEINGKPYTGVLNTDYQIQNSRVFQIRNLHQYFVPTYFDYTMIKYEYGFETIPADIELMARLLVIGMYNEKYPMGYGNGGQVNLNGITNYRLGDESIAREKRNINSITAWKDYRERNTFMSLLLKYKKQQNALR